MKKSKFLKNPKDLVSRSFNSSKCKTALKLAGSRVKLLKNKKEAQVKQIKREIAQLLESGQVQNARIRVEHVVREEKMMDAYELIAIYCEVIVARMQIIETQKICPMDLKEAITSLMFASPRCGDVPELGDVKKHFTDKYGKDFATAAVELRPESGVSRMMVEKLSAIAPDGQTKIKILSAIADEHDVKWDPESFQDKESLPPTPTELLKGPRTFEEAKIHVDPPRAESLDNHAPQSNRMHHSVSNLSQPDYRSSMGEERHTSPQTSVDNTAFHRESPTSVCGQLFPGDGNTNPWDRQRWNMQFKDATSAAQAAAESAERASMAARAAAELSSREKFMRQYSSESQKSDSYASEHRGPETFVNSTFAREQVFEEQRNKSFSVNTGLWNEHIDGMQPNDQRTGGTFNENSHGGVEEFSQSGSATSKASPPDNSLDHDIPAIYGYSQKISLQETSRGEMNVQRQPFKHENARAGKHDNVREGRIGKQPSVAYSHSRSNITDDVNMFADHEEHQFKSDAGEDPFMASGRGRVYGESLHTRYDEAAAVFDKSDSEGGIPGMSPKYDDYEPEFHLPTSSQKSYEHLSANPDSWSQRSNSGKGKFYPSPSLTGDNFSDVSYNLKPSDGSKINDTVSVTYDESDGSASENDMNNNFSRHTGIKDSRDPPSKYDQSMRQEGKGHSGFDRKQFSFSPDDELASDIRPATKSRLGKSSFNQPVLAPRNSQVESDDSDDSSPNVGLGLNYPKPRGGLRHKGHKPLPLLGNRSDTPSSFSKKGEVAAATTTRPTVPASRENPRISTLYGHNRSEIINDSNSVSDNEISGEEESTKKGSNQKLRQNIPRAGKDVSIKPTLGASKSFFGSDNSDSDEDAPKESLTRKSHKQSGISRRTTGLFSSSGKTSYSKMHLSSGALDFDDAMDWKSGNKTSETPKTYKSWRSSSQMDNDEQPTSSKASSRPALSNFWGPTEPSSSGKAAPSTTRESEVQFRSEAHDYDANVGRIPTNSSTPETRQQYPSLRKNFSKLGNPEPPISSKAASKPHNQNLRQTPDEHNPAKLNSTAMQESKKTWNSSTSKESSRAPPETGSCISTENVKPATTLSKTSSNNQRARHVHPKLPDYDTLVETFRKNRA